MPAVASKASRMLAITVHCHQNPKLWRSSWWSSLLKLNFCFLETTARRRPCLRPAFYRVICWPQKESVDINRKRRYTACAGALPEPGVDHLKQKSYSSQFENFRCSKDSRTIKLKPGVRQNIQWERYGLEKNHFGWPSLTIWFAWNSIRVVSVCMELKKFLRVYDQISNPYKCLQQNSIQTHVP